MFISCNFIAGVEPAAAFSLGWDFDFNYRLKENANDGAFNEMMMIEALVDGMRSKTPPGEKRATGPLSVEPLKDAVVFRQ